MPNFSSPHFSARRSLLGLLALVLITADLLTGCSFSNRTPAVASATQQIIKSPTDSRDYLALELPNQLKVLIISDPGADKAAAALSVAAGSGSDPEDRQGLAHFLEHMLFLGTEKYPEAGAYQRFISEHGGSHNAYTAFDETTYFFDVKAADLEPALDQFAQFFIAPLFNAQYVEREKHAVDSEYQAKIKDDSRLQYEVLKTHMNPAHPYSRFSVGSLDTLADRDGHPVRDDLLAFYQQHYSANLMTLVILGNQSTEQLRKLVTDKFTAVENHQRSRPSFEQPLINTDQLPLRITTLPNKNLRRVIYQFPVPSTQPYYLSKPIHYITNLLGHEGQGSLLSYLKQRGWAQSLSAGMGLETDQQGLAQISIGLTEQGLQEIDAITQALFEAIALIKQQGIAAWRYQEQSQLADIAFKFQENGNNMHYVTQLASQLHTIPVKDVLRAPYSMEQFDPALIAHFLAALEPGNMLMTVIAQGLPAEQTTQHYQAPYSSQPIAADTIEHWRQAASNGHISLPAANPFIPANLAIEKQPEQPQSAPKKTSSASDITLWHRLDTHFNNPRADFYFTLRSVLANSSAANTALTELYVKSVNEQLNEFSYPASLAGLNYQLYPHVRGMSVRISGYQDKQPLLLEKIIHIIANPTIDPAAFARHKDQLLRRWHNASQQKPYNQALGWVSKVLMSPSWNETELSSALESLSQQDLEQFIDAFLAQLDIVVLANGNIKASAAQRMTQQINTALMATDKSVQVSRPNIAKLPPNEKQLYEFKVDHSDSAVVSYFQAADKTLPSRARFALLNQVIATPFYHELRTQKQLGYIVFSSPLGLLDVPAMAFTVQSPNTPAARISAEIDGFIQHFQEVINTLDEAGLAQHKQALISRIMEKDVRLAQRSNRYWYEIDRNNSDFDTREQLVKAIEAIDLATLKTSYQEYFIDQPRQLTLVARGNAMPDTQSTALASYMKVADDKQLQRAGVYFQPL